VRSTGSISSRRRWREALRFPALLILLTVAAAPARAESFVLICYLYYSGSGSTGQFTRRLDIDKAAKRVAIADDTNRTGFKPLGYYGTLVTADENTIVFDYASPRSIGRTTINRRDGTATFSDQHVVGRGTCSPSEL
jgi:hypothetical protein